MKKILNLITIVVVMTMVMSSCGKTGSNTVTPNPGGGGTPPLVVVPSYLSLKASDSAALYDGSIAITITTDGKSVVMDNTGVAVVNGSVTISYLKGDSTISFTAKDSIGTKTLTKSIVLHTYSQKTTQLQGYTPLHMTFNKVCIDGAQNILPIVWLMDGFIDPTYWVRFYANGHTQSNLGNGFWFWNNSTEESINFGANDVWHIILFADGFDRWQIKNGFYTLQKFRQ